MTRLLALLLVVLAAACTGPPAGGSSASTPTPASAAPTAVASVAPTGTSTPTPTPTPRGEPVAAGEEADPDADLAVVEQGWGLAEVTADGRHLVVTTSLGPCDLVYDPVVEETAALVTIRTVHAAPVDPSEPCDGPTVDVRLVVELDEPLGDRGLTGCEAESCGLVDTPQVAARRPRSRPAVVGDVVVAEREPLTPDDPGRIVGLEADSGQVLWEATATSGGRRLSHPTAAGDHVVLVDRGTRAVVVLDPATGAEVTSFTGWNPASGDPAAQVVGPLFVAVRDDGAIEAREIATGTVVWTADPAGDAVVGMLPRPGQLVVTSGTPCCEVPDHHTVVEAYAAGTGEILWRTPVAGGPLDLMDTSRHLPGTAAVHVVGGVVALDLATGTQVWVESPSPTTGLADLGVALLTRPEDPADDAPVLSGRTGRVIDFTTLDTPVVVDPAGHLQIDLRAHRVLADGTAVVSEVGAVTRRDVTETATTQPVDDPDWRTVVAALPSTATVAGGRVLVSTPLGVRALDLDTGRPLWGWADVG